MITQTVAATPTPTTSIVLPGILALERQHPTFLVPSLIPGGLTPAAVALIASSTMAPGTASTGLTAADIAYPIGWAGEQTEPPADAVGPAVVGSRVGDTVGRKSHHAPAADGENVRSEPVLTAVSGSGTGSSATGAAGFFFFGVAGLLASFALGVPRLSCRLRLVKELDAPPPFVLLLDRPG